jgi:hypothetical protein
MTKRLKVTRNTKVENLQDFFLKKKTILKNSKKSFKFSTFRVKLHF